MQTLRAGSVIFDEPVPFDCLVYYGTTLLRRYQDYHPVFTSGSSDMLALNLWTQVPEGTVLTIKDGNKILQAEVKFGPPTGFVPSGTGFAGGDGRGGR